MEEAAKVAPVCTMETASKLALDSRVETAKVVMEASVKAAEVVEATLRKTIELNM